MIQLGSVVKVTDKTCVVLAQCIKTPSYSKKLIAFLADVIIVSVYWISPRKYALLKLRAQRKFNKGTIHKGLLLRVKVNFKRIFGIFFKFGENAVVLVTKTIVPVTNRVYGPVLREMCMRWPSLGCVTTCLI